MGKSLIKAAGVVAATAALALVFPAVATAAGPGADFGQHVRQCAQSMGFVGWDPSHVC